MIVGEGCEVAGDDGLDGKGADAIGAVEHEEERRGGGHAVQGSCH